MRKEINKIFQYTNHTSCQVPRDFFCILLATKRWGEKKRERESTVSVESTTSKKPKSDGKKTLKKTLEENNEMIKI